jgi:hypothetical protein
LVILSSFLLVEFYKPEIPTLNWLFLEIPHPGMP